MLRVWNMVLVVLTFVLCLFGTFLTRSGLIESVHAFGESTLGPFFLGFIVLVAAVSFGLIVARLDDLRSQHTLESYLSREAIFLFNNLLLLAMAFAVFWGTMFPVLTEAVQGNRIVVGQGFYNQVAAPIGIALLILTGVGPLVAWRKASPAQLRRRFTVPLAAAAASVVPLVLLTDVSGHWVAAFTVVAAVFVATCVLGEFWRGARVRHAVGDTSWPGAVVSMVARNRRRYGGYIVHLGVVVLFIGFAGSKGFATEADREVARGASVEVAGYTFVNRGAERLVTPHATTTQVRLEVLRDGRRVTTLTPGIHQYAVDDVRGAKLGIHSTPMRDLHVVATEIAPSGTAQLAIYINPLVMWIWIAGGIMTAGGIVAGWPSRARPSPRAASAAPPPKAGASA